MRVHVEVIWECEGCQRQERRLCRIGDCGHLEPSRPDNWRYATGWNWPSEGAFICNWCGAEEDRKRAEEAAQAKRKRR